MVKKIYFGFFLVSYISFQKKKYTSEQFLQGRPNGGDEQRSLHLLIPETLQRVPHYVLGRQYLYEEPF